MTVDPLGEPVDRPDAPTSSGVVHPWEYLRGSGLLWLVNRTVLHPRGFALGLHYPDGIGGTDEGRARIERGEVEPDGWVLYGDGTEPWRYGLDEATEARLFADVARLLAPAPGAPLDPATGARLDALDRLRAGEHLHEQSPPAAPPILPPGGHPSSALDPPA